MLASELLRRLIPSGASFDVNALGALSAVGNVAPFAGPGVLLWGKTGVVNLLATGTYAVDLPVVAGKTAVIINSKIIQVARTGTATGTVAYTVGTNSPTFDNFQNAGAIVAANFNALATGGQLTGFTAGSASPSMATAMSVKITTPFGGASVATAFFVIGVVYV